MSKEAKDLIQARAGERNDSWATPQAPLLVSHGMTRDHGSCRLALQAPNDHLEPYGFPSHLDS